MSHQQRIEAATGRMLAILEKSSLLSNAQRSVLSGPNKDAADVIRKGFLPIVEASIGPYLAGDGGSESTSALPDEQASQLPASLRAFLPFEQQERLVGAANFELNRNFVNFVNFVNFIAVLFCLARAIDQRRNRDPFGARQEEKN